MFKKASVDADFRARCLSDPNAAVKDAAGVEVPAGLKIKFVEPGSAIVVTLPPLCASEEHLEEELLGRIAGGVPDSPHTKVCY